jgi:hypothetical protein
MPAQRGSRGDRKQGREGTLPDLEIAAEVTKRATAPLEEEVTARDKETTDEIVVSPFAEVVNPRR